MGFADIAEGVQFSDSDKKPTRKSSGVN